MSILCSIIGIISLLSDFLYLEWFSGHSKQTSKFHEFYVPFEKTHNFLHI